MVKKMSTKSSDNRRGILRTIPQERDYPDPRTLPAQPSWQQPRPQLTLSELIPGKYVAATARIVHLKTSERHDALGNKLVFSGILEDSTFKVPFVSHRISYPLIRNSVYKFYSTYVDEFEDKSLLLVVTERTKIEPKNIDDYREFAWAPKIESIERPVHQIALQGVITTIHSNSGLVKRCNKCKSILYDSCPNKCDAINVIVHFRECSVSHPLAFKATLIKHQYAKTPKSVIINTRKTGRIFLLDR